MLIGTFEMYNVKDFICGIESTNNADKAVDGRKKGEGEKINKLLKHFSSVIDSPYLINFGGKVKLCQDCNLSLLLSTTTSHSVWLIDVSI